MRDLVVSRETITSKNEDDPKIKESLKTEDELRGTK